MHDGRGGKAGKEMLYFEKFDVFVEGTYGIIQGTLIQYCVLSKDRNTKMRLLSAKINHSIPPHLPSNHNIEGDKGILGNNTWLFFHTHTLYPSFYILLYNLLQRDIDRKCIN